MKRLIALLVLLLLGFYVGWPAWTGYQIASAIKARDSATLERKISFADVRRTLRPAAVQKIGEAYDSQKAQAGPAGAAIFAQIKQDVVPKIADTALTLLVTAPNLIRVVSDGGTLKDNAERILREQVGKIGLPGLSGVPGVGGSGGGPLPGGINLPAGLGNIAGKLGIDPSKIPGLGGIGGAGKKDDAPAAQTPATGTASPATTSGPSPSFGLSNIKRFSFLGPLGFEIGLAKEAGATDADVIVEMRFTDGDWRVTGVRPRI